MEARPLCFVLMPFGRKKDPTTGLDIDFDRIYETAIRPGIETADMLPIRADEERTGGVIHKPMFERLMLCDYAVADLTSANANVFYELGVRHAVRPATTLTIFARQQPIPFDVNYLRSLPYDLGQRNRFGSREAADLQRMLTKRLEELRAVRLEDAVADSPVFQLLQDYAPPEIARLKTDVFRERARYAVEIKSRLARGRESHDAAALESVERELGDLDGAESGVIVDLYLSYRALERWDAMIALHERMPAALKRTVLVREQLAFALNRKQERNAALEVLEGVLSEHGPSSETYGLVGRIYKDKWAEARQAGREHEAQGHLERAIESYVKGYEADFRDAYPGINAVTLLELKGDTASLQRRDELLPVVRYAVQLRLRGTTPDYWDHATLLELAVLAGDESEARSALGRALSAAYERWMPRTTANNLRMIRDAREARGDLHGCLDDLLGAMEAAAGAV